MPLPKKFIEKKNLFRNIKKLQDIFTPVVPPPPLPVTCLSSKQLSPPQKKTIGPVRKSHRSQNEPEMASRV